MSTFLYKLALGLAGGFGTLTPVFAGTQAPVGSSQTISTEVDKSYTFQVTDFGFSDPNDAPADNFNAVRISTLPTLGTLKLHGNAIPAGTLVSTLEISTGELTYTPEPSGTGVPYTDFTFQVHDNGQGNVNRVTLITPTSADARSFQNNGTIAFNLPTTDSSDLNISGEFLSGINRWGTWQPYVTTVTTTLFGADVTFPTLYLDQLTEGTSSARNTKWTFKNGTTEAHSASLGNVSRNYTYIFGIAGLGGESSEYIEVTSDVMLTVVGTGDAFGTENYSLLDGQETRNAEGLTGRVISTNTPRTSQGYTFFSLPSDASSITLTQNGMDAHGITFGVVETDLAATLDPNPKTITFNVRANPVITGAKPVPAFSNWVILSLTLLLLGIALKSFRPRR